MIQGFLAGRVTQERASQESQEIPGFLESQESRVELGNQEIMGLQEYP